MNFLLIIYSYFLLSVNSILVDDCDNESITYLFKNDEIEFNRNVNMGISCHTYNFDKIKFYENDTRSEFIEYLEKTKSITTDRPAMTFISIILYQIPNLKICKSEIHKIMQFILSPEDSNEYPSNIENLYKIEIIKMDINQERKDLFSKLPDFSHTDTFSYEKIMQNSFNIFILEDIRKNDILIRSLRKEIMNFFFLNSIKNKGYTLMKILIIEAIDSPKKCLIDDMNLRYTSNKKLMIPTMYMYFAAFELLENKNSYSHNIIELSHHTDFYKKNNIYKTQFGLNINLSTLYLYKKSDIENLDYYIKFIDSNIEFEIYKHVDTNDTYAKLMNFLGYSPLEKFYQIKILLKNGIQGSYSFKVKVSISKKIIKKANNQVPEIFNNIKQIIISRVNNDNTHNVLIDYSYQMNIHSSEGFPLCDKERETIQEKEYNENIEAKKLTNFIDFYESFMLGRHYFYFFNVYNTNIDLNNGFCFYKKEIWFKYLKILQIYEIIKNSFNFYTGQDLKSKHKILVPVKSIEVFEFTREYTKNKTLNNLYDNTEVLKVFKHHHFFEIELRFYTNIQLVKHLNVDNKNSNINNFIKIDFGCNKTYFIFFREILNNRTDNETFYDLINIKNEAIIFLKPIIEELLNLEDDEEAKIHTLNFIDVIFNTTKIYLNNNLELKYFLCHNLRKELDFFLPKTQKWILIYIEIANNVKKRISCRKFKLISKLFISSIGIIKRNFKNMLYEACVLRSLSNLTDNSQEILESLL